MSIKTYADNPESLGKILWAVQTAMTHVLAPVPVRVTKQDLRDMERGAIKPRGLLTHRDGDDLELWVEYGPLSARLAASLIVAANAASFYKRGGEDGNENEIWWAVDRMQKPVVPDAVLEDPNMAGRAAWSILDRVEYNILPDAMLGEAALRLLGRLKAELAHSLLYMNTGL